MKPTIGIDLGGTNVKGILLHESGEILAQHYIATNDDADGRWKENILAMVHHLQNIAQQQVNVIGLSCPGIANENNSCINHMPGRLAGLERFVWDDYLGAKTFVINDAHAALMAERGLGVLREYNNAVLLTLGTGVGGALLINGSLYQGLNQLAGHFGHTSIDTGDSETSILGIPGSLEFSLGNYSVKKRSSGKFQNTQAVVDAYRLGDTFATWLWLDMIRKLAITIASLANSLSPETVVLAGGITKAGDALFNPLEDFLAIFEFRPDGKQKTIIQQARFSDLSGAIGAAVFANLKINER